MRETWLLDITRYPDVAFVPYETETNCVVWGMTVLSNKCPGTLVGVVSQGGQEGVEKWISENPDWHSCYAS